MTRLDQSHDGKDGIDEFNLNQRRSVRKSVELCDDREALGLLGQMDKIVHRSRGRMSVDQIGRMAVGRSERWSADRVSSPLLLIAEFLC